jgi:hypothetical protein
VRRAKERTRHLRANISDYMSGTYRRFASERALYNYAELTVSFSSVTWREMLASHLFFTTSIASLETWFMIAYSGVDTVIDGD